MHVSASPSARDPVGLLRLRVASVLVDRFSLSSSSRSMVLRRRLNAHRRRGACHADADGGQVVLPAGLLENRAICLEERVVRAKMPEIRASWCAPRCRAAKRRNLSRCRGRAPPSAARRAPSRPAPMRRCADAPRTPPPQPRPDAPTRPTTHAVSVRQASSSDQAAFIRSTSSTRAPSRSARFHAASSATWLRTSSRA